MVQFGLIGKTLTHSLSEVYFKNKFTNLGLKDVYYSLYTMDNVADIQTLISKNPFLKGLNVTIPFKTDVMLYTNELDETVSAIGAVNTLKIYRDNKKTRIKGFNTDYLGFLDSLKALDYRKHKKALILGTGGSAKAVAYALDLLGIKYLFVSRQKKNEKTIGYKEINKDILNSYTLIVNTTPLGMYPELEDCPDIPFQCLDTKHLLYDLIYNPPKTVFLKKGQQQKAYICNGLNMLYIQAEYSWKIWNDENF